MPTLILKDVPAELVERLKADAERSRRSLDKEAIAQLEESVVARIARDEAWERIETRRRSMTKLDLSIEELERLINEDHR